MLNVGDSAPDFTAQSTQGEFTLSEAGDLVVLFFFPKAGSPVCTREACSFRDSMAEFNDLDATIVGISPNDSLEKLEEFADDNGLDFPLVSDTSGSISELYDIEGAFGLYEKRVTYVVEDGRIAGVVEGMFRAKKHVEKSLEAIKS
ncbi:MAG: peroxiredoxin [Halobacteria archaeon]|nr:peroxiredoxin [Halobacteria archaeon]